jgi:threonine/homoserine/homoserine lactone efflux protein
VFAIGTVAAYSTVNGNPWWETSVIAAVNAATCLISVLLWAGFGTVIGRTLRNQRIRTLFNWSMAGLLVLSLLPVFW